MKKNLKNVINKYEYVSFDVFDTLIIRTVEKPEDVFAMMEEDAREYSIVDFVSKRKNAEKYAVSNKNTGEITLDEIYNNMSVLPEIAYNLKKKEIEVELSVCKANPFFCDILKFCKNKNKKIVIISDMYLPEQVIRRILANANINFDYLFVSSEYGCRKSRGTLFKIAIQELDIKPKQMIHIGDNFHSDFVMAKINGIRAIRYNE